MPTLRNSLMRGFENNCKHDKNNKYSRIQMSVVMFLSRWTEPCGCELCYQLVMRGKVLEYNGQ